MPKWIRLNGGEHRDTQVVKKLWVEENHSTPKWRGLNDEENIIQPNCWKLTRGRSFYAKVVKTWWRRSWRCPSCSKLIRGKFVVSKIDRLLKVALLDCWGQHCLVEMLGKLLRAALPDGNSWWIVEGSIARWILVDELVRRMNLSMALLLAAIYKTRVVLCLFSHEVCTRNSPLCLSCAEKFYVLYLCCMFRGL